MNCPYRSIGQVIPRDGSRHHYLVRWCVLQADHDGEHDWREQRQDDHDMPPIQTDIHLGLPLKRATPHEPPPQGDG